MNLGANVGIVHHPFCMNHSVEKKPLSMTSFVEIERPQRIKAILDRLREENLLSCCEIIDDFE